MPVEVFYIFALSFLVPLFIILYDVVRDAVENRRIERQYQDEQQLEARRSPYSKGYKAFDLTQKHSGRQSFVLGLLEHPMFYKKVNGEKQYRIHFIMEEVMLTYSSEWRFHDIVPRKNNEDEEQFWMGARDAILHYINKDIKSQEVRANSLDRAEKRQKAIDELY